jgi:hypothetical protein
MAFKLTYSDGQEDDYDDSTQWIVEDGVLKMGRDAGEWTVLVSPSHWATIEVSQGKDEPEDQHRNGDQKDDDQKDEDRNEDEKDEDT